MENLASVTISVSKAVFKNIKNNLSGIFPDLDAKIKYLPASQVEVTLSIPETENNEEMLEDFLFMVGNYMRVLRRAEKFGKNLAGEGIDFTKTITYAGTTREI